MGRFFHILLLIVFLSQFTYALRDDTILEEITFPDDSKDYRALQLSNGIQVILVSDEDCDFAAAALSVTVGAFHNPPEVQGLAHFLEHLLSQGMSASYPDKETYFKFLFENGGHYQAFTYSDVTKYGFHILPDSFELALDMFASSFAFPILTSSLILQELPAVNSEYMINLHKEADRIFSVQSSTTFYNKNHSFSNFNNGNYKTLWEKPLEMGINLQDELRGFFDQHYTTNRMHLAVIGPQNLDELQETVEAAFLKISKSNGSLENQFENDSNPYLNVNNERIKRVDIFPLSNVTELHLVFPVPYNPQSFSTSVLSYVVHLINSQGNGSLSKFLKSKGLSKFVECEESTESGFSFISVKFGLTPSGERKVKNVITYFFQFIQTLRESEGHEEIWDELYQMSELQHKFTSDESEIDYVMKLSANMPNYPLETILFAEGPNPDPHFSDIELFRILYFIHPQTLTYYVISKSCKESTKFTEEYYNVSYNVRNVTKRQIKEWAACKSNKKFYLPKSNPFFPKLDSTLRPLEQLNTSIPQTLLKTNNSEVWYVAMDGENGWAKVSGNILSQIANRSPLDSVFTSIWVAMANDALAETIYLASEVGTTAKVQETELGISVTVTGFSENFDVILDKIFSNIASSVFPTSKEFNNIKEEIERLEKNSFVVDAPNEQADNLRLTLLENDKWSNLERIESMKDVTLPRFMAFLDDFLRSKKFLWIFSGHLTQNETLRMVKSCESHLKNELNPLEQSWPKLKGTQMLAPGSDYVYKVDNPLISSSVSQQYFQLQNLDTSIQTDVMTLMLHKIGEYYANDILRQNYHLGYSVGFVGYADEGLGGGGIKVEVMGNYHPQFVQEKIDKFLLEIKEALLLTSEETFQKYKTNTEIQIDEESTGFDFIVSEILSGRKNFDMSLKQQEALKNITLTQLLEFYENNVLNPLTRRRLCIQLISPLGLKTPVNFDLNYTTQVQREIRDPRNWRHEELPM